MARQCLQCHVLTVIEHHHPPGNEHSVQSHKVIPFLRYANTQFKDRSTPCEQGSALPALLGMNVWTTYVLVSLAVQILMLHVGSWDVGLPHHQYASQVVILVPSVTKALFRLSEVTMVSHAYFVILVRCCGANFRPHWLLSYGFICLFNYINSPMFIIHYFFYPITTFTLCNIYYKYCNCMYVSGEHTCR